VAKWEDPLIVEFNGKTIHIFRFGALVFFGHSEKESFEFIGEIEKHSGKNYSFGRIDFIEFEIVEQPPIEIKNWKDEEFYFDPYSEFVYFNKSLFIPNFHKILSFTIAQSVTLERFDKLADELEEEVDNIINWFSKFRLLMPLLGNKSLNKTIKILKTRHYIISDLMILDKPYTAWENTACDELYEIISRHFELSRRYKVIESKLDYGIETAQTLTNKLEHSRANFLELLIVIMILWEIIWELLKIKIQG